MATKLDVIHSYRHLYRHLLRAVQYAKPARYIARDIMRSSFRGAAVPGGEALRQRITAEGSPAETSSRLEDMTRAEGDAHPNQELAQGQLDLEAVRRTKWFLKAAAEERGLEHRIVKNIIRVRGEELHQRANYRRYVAEVSSRKSFKESMETSREHFEMTIAMLNHSMGLCLRSGR